MGAPPTLSQAASRGRTGHVVSKRGGWCSKTNTPVQKERRNPPETSTPAVANTQPREATQSTSSIESVLESLPSDSSVLNSLNAVIDEHCPAVSSMSSISGNSALSNASDFDVLVTATTLAEVEHAMRENYRSTRADSTISDVSSSSNSLGTPQRSPAQKRRLRSADTPSKLGRLDLEFGMASLNVSREPLFIEVGVSPRGPGTAPPALPQRECVVYNSGVGVSPRRVGTAPTTPSSQVDPLALTPAPTNLTNILDMATPSPYAILPTPEAVLGLDNSISQETPSSIGTSTTWSPPRENTPDNLFLPTRFHTIKLSKKSVSSARRSSSSTRRRNRHSRTPFDRHPPRSPMVLQSVSTSLLEGIAALPKSENGPESPSSK